MTRAHDHATSVAAADRVRATLTELQAKVLAAFVAAGPTGLTDRELEDLPEFEDFAPSTVRKRRSELLYAVPALVRAVRDAAGKVVSRDGLTVWVAA